MPKMVIFLKSYFFTPSPPLLKDLENYNMNLGYQSILQHKTIHFFRFRSCRQTHNSAAFRNGPSGTSIFGKVFSFFFFFFLFFFQNTFIVIRFFIFYVFRLICLRPDCSKHTNEINVGS